MKFSIRRGEHSRKLCLFKFMYKYTKYRNWWVLCRWGAEYMLNTTLWKSEKSVSSSALLRKPKNVYRFFFLCFHCQVGYQIGCCVAAFSLSFSLSLSLVVDEFDCSKNYYLISRRESVIKFGSTDHFIYLLFVIYSHRQLLSRTTLIFLCGYLM